MESYKALWADDLWKKCKGLTATLKKIEDELLNIGITVNWKKCITAESAGTELLDNNTDYRIAILDAKYPRREIDSAVGYDWKNCRRSSQIRGIPYIIYTDYLKDVKKELEGERIDPLLIGLFSKDTKGTIKLINRVKEFFRAPPIRILHMTDLHYGISLSDIQKEDARKMWDALLDVLENRHSTMPFDAIAITGDFALNQPDIDLTEVLSKIKELVKRTIGMENIERLMIVPGNHDMQWDHFENGIIGEKPWRHYLHFMHALYSKRIDVMESMFAWSKENDMPNHDANSDELIWHRKIRGTQIEAIGFCTTTNNPEEKGTGSLSERQLEYLEKRWRGEPLPGIIRIGLMHHNIFSILSRSEMEERRIINNSGSAIHALMSYKCNIVLSGHAHTTNAIRFDSSQLTQEGNEIIGGLTVVSTGTTGGFHDSRMRPRTCCILEFSDLRYSNNTRKLNIKSLVYQDYNKKWIETTKSASFII